MTGFLRTTLVPVIAALAVLLVTTVASAHSSSNSYLGIDVAGDTLRVQWSIALRDLDYAIGLDSDGDGAVTWGEVRARAAAIDAYALSRLAFTADGAPCVAGPVEHLADQLSDGGYVVLRFQAACPAPPHRLGVQYRLLFDLDPQHRGLLRLTLDGVTHAAALSPAQPAANFDAKARFGATFQEFFVAGVAHLFGGADHLLFVVMLLVPAMFARRSDGLARLSHWVAVPRFGPAFLEAVKVLSAFTLAHALTLTSAVLGHVPAAAPVIEAGIALTILATAIDNVWHVLPGRRWMLAFCFGLIHGFGYAGTLGPLALPPLPLAAALLSFNLGLEAAQLVVAAVLLPAGFLARNSRIYRARLLPGLSGAVALLALLWFTDKAAGVQLLPF
jgi:hypothetical protein